MAYVGQRDSYSCGPIAVGNAIKHYRAFNYSKNRKRIMRVLRTCHCGTPVARMTSGLRKLLGSNFVVIKSDGPYKWYFDEMLQKGYAAIVSWKWPGEREGHYAFFEPRKKGQKYYRVANYNGRGQAVSSLANWVVRRNVFSYHRRLHVWFVRER